MSWLARAGLCGALSAACAACAMGDVPGASGGDTAGGATGTPASSSGTYGSSGAPSDCAHTTDRFSFQLTEGEGQAYGCGATTGEMILSAQVTSVDATSAELVACPAGTGCHGTSVTLTVSSEDLMLTLAPNAFVLVQASVQEGDAGCVESLMVTNLPSLGGVTNPVTTEPILWFAGGDGTLATPAGSPLHLGDAPGCGAEGSTGFVDDKLSFTFDGVASLPTTVALPMGVPYPIQGHGGGTWLLLDLRSFHRAGAPAGDQRDFAYWVSYEPPGP